MSASKRNFGPERFNNLTELLDKEHDDFLTNVGSNKIEALRLFRGYAAQYLHEVPHNSKFKLSSTDSVLSQSILQNPNFEPREASIAFENLATYAHNLIEQPWRKEFYNLKLTSGFFLHNIKAFLVNSQEMLIRIGYVGTDDYTFVLPQLPDRKILEDFSRDCYIASQECLILSQIFERALSEAPRSDYPLTLREVFEVRRERTGDTTTIVKHIVYLLREREEKRQEAAERERIQRDYEVRLKMDSERLNAMIRSNYNSVPVDNLIGSTASFTPYSRPPKDYVMRDSEPTYNNMQNHSPLPRSLSNHGLSGLEDGLTTASLTSPTLKPSPVPRDPKRHTMSGAYLLSTPYPDMKYRQIVSGTESNRSDSSSRNSEREESRGTGYTVADSKFIDEIIEEHEKSSERVERLSTGVMPKSPVTTSSAYGNFYPTFNETSSRSPSTIPSSSLFKKLKSRQDFKSNIPRLYSTDHHKNTSGSNTDSRVPAKKSPLPEDFKNVPESNKFVAAHLTPSSSSNSKSYNFIKKTKVSESETNFERGNGDTDSRLKNFISSSGKSSERNGGISPSSVYEEQTEERASEKWSCPHCTYLNVTNAKVCEICSKSKDFVATE